MTISAKHFREVRPGKHAGVSLRPLTQQSPNRLRDKNKKLNRQSILNSGEMHIAIWSGILTRGSPILRLEYL
jgi:hypothetical protein